MQSYRLYWIVLVIGFAALVAGMSGVAATFINCSAYLGSSHMGLNGKCAYHDEAVVGIQGDNVWCAPVRVSCFQ